MRALAKTTGSEGCMEVVDREVPTPGTDEALVEVAYAGVCGSDTGIYDFEGAYGFMTFPRVIGHEFSGTVAAVGDDVVAVSTGDRVVAEPVVNCGTCHQCRTGYPNVCRDATVIGAHHDGGFAEYVTVPARLLHPVPEELSLRRAAAAEPTSVAVRAVVENSTVRAGSRVLVEGPGPIGLLTAQVARAQGGDVTVTGVDADAAVRLPLAADLGFETANVADRDVVDVRAEYTDGDRFDVVFDVTGHESGLRAAATAVRKRGQVVLVGLSDHVSLDFTTLVRGETAVQPSYASTWADFERSLRTIRDGSVAVEPLFDDRFGLGDSDRLFAAAKAGETVKPLFELAGEA